MAHRPQLPLNRISSAALDAIRTFHADVIAEVESAIAESDVVVVGMAVNSHVKKVREALDAAGVAYRYLEYGGYLSDWQKRLAIKLWSGWPTFPQVFVKGVLLGGEDLTKAALADGTLKARLADGASAAA